MLGRVVSGLAASIRTTDEPLVVVLNHIHEIDSRECQDALGLLLDLLPAQVQLVVSSRRDVWLAGGRRRMRGEVLEIGAGDLVFDEAETAEFLALIGAHVSPDRVDQLHSLTEGWPAGLVLLAPTRTSDPVMIRPAAATAAPLDRNVVEFVRSEVLAGLSPQTARFLHQTAILDVLCPALCDAVVDSTESASILEMLIDGGLFVTPLDGASGWSRYHPLFRGVLIDEISRSDPTKSADSICAPRGGGRQPVRPDHTIQHARAGGDLTIAAELLAEQIPVGIQPGSGERSQEMAGRTGRRDGRGLPRARRTGWVAGSVGRESRRGAAVGRSSRTPRTRYGLAGRVVRRRAAPPSGRSSVHTASSRWRPTRDRS